MYLLHVKVGALVLDVRFGTPGTDQHTYVRDLKLVTAICLIKYNR